MQKILASEVAALNSNVNFGGGTDVTEALQKVLDKAPECGGIHLVMDGAALVHGLKVHSNTVIECINADCGFFMADYANRPILSNYNWSLTDKNSRNIRIIGGTYNHNCTKQEHHLSAKDFPYPPTKEGTTNLYDEHGIYLMEFYGVENLYLQDIKFKNQRTYTLTVGNFKNVIMENDSIEMAEHVHPSNQDGFHFFGPGQFLTMKNVRGCTGDDFINIAADELDGASSITDVLIDGVFFDNVCQGIRMLSRDKGALDRITVRNVTGTFRSFAFSINPFYRGNFGKYGDIFIENVDLRQLDATYHYTPMTFMQLGGDMDCITLKNVRFRSPVRNSMFLDLGNPYFYRPDELTDAEIEKYRLGSIEANRAYKIDWMYEDRSPKIKTFVLDNVIFESDSSADEMQYIVPKYDIENLIIRNVKLFRSEDSKVSGNLIALGKRASIDKMFLEDIYAERVNCILTGENSHKIGTLIANNVTLKDGNTVFDMDAASVGNRLENAVNKLDSETSV